MRVTGALKTVAVYEAVKGVLVLLLGSGVISLLHLHSNVQALALQLIEHYHLNPTSRFPRIFIDTVAKLNDRRLWMLAGFAFIYVVLRFVEAYGLWKARAWAEWLTALSSAIYIPFEVVELVQHASWLGAATLVLNLAIVGFMAYCLNSKNATQPIHPIHLHRTHQS